MTMLAQRIGSLKRKPMSGFTLIELLVVIVILAILAAIVLPKFSDQGRRSKEAALKSDLATVRSAIGAFQADTGFSPKLLSDLAATSAPATGYDSSGVSQTITATDWHGPYITGSVPNDPISGSAFTYSVASGSVGNVSSSAAAGTKDLAGTLLSTF